MVVMRRVTMMVTMLLMMICGDDTIANGVIIMLPADDYDAFEVLISSGGFIFVSTFVAS